MNVSRKIIAVFCCIAILISCLVVPVSAASGLSGVIQNFIEWSVRFDENATNSFWRLIYGDDWRSAEREQLKTAYDNYVSDLPASGYTSSGGLIWSVSISDLLSSCQYGNIASTTSFTEFDPSALPLNFTGSPSGSLVQNDIYSISANYSAGSSSIGLASLQLKLKYTHVDFYEKGEVVESGASLLYDFDRLGAFFEGDSWEDDRQEANT